MRRSWGRRSDGEPIFWYHSQNLNERKQGPDGPLWRHGRAWLHYNDGRERDHQDRALGWEWVVGTREPWPKIGLAFNANFGDEYDLTFSVRVPFLGSFFVNVEGLFPCRWRGDEKNFAVELYHEYLWIEFFWSDPAWTWGENKNRFPAFRISFNWQDFLFGEQQHKREWLSPLGGDRRDAGIWTQEEMETAWRPISIPLPEGSYAARYRLERRTWWRARWPKRLVKVAADIDIPGGLPIPGKGENSWDCGDDAYFGLSCRETDEPSIIAACVKAAMATRKRYGSLAWRPKEKQP